MTALKPMSGTCTRTKAESGRFEAGSGALAEGLAATVESSFQPLEHHMHVIVITGVLPAETAWVNNRTIEVGEGYLI
jgi:hypothetical protein